MFLRWVQLRFLGLRLSLLVVLALCVGLPSAAEARDVFVLLKTVTVKSGAKTHTVFLPRPLGQFRGFRLRAKSGRVNLTRVTVRYRKSKTRVIKRSIMLRSGVKVPPLVLARTRDARSLRQIKLEFGKRRQARAVLEIYGVRAGTDPAWRTTVDKKPAEKKRVVRRRKTVAKTSNRSGTARKRGKRDSDLRAALDVLAEQRRRQEQEREQARQAQQRETAERQRRSEAQRSAEIGQQKRQRAEAERRAQLEAQLQEARQRRAEAELRARRRAAEAQRERAVVQKSSERRARTRARRRPAQVTPDCVTQSKCTAVRVFFGTNRASKAPDHPVRTVGFSGDRREDATIEDEITLGRAIVTVPRHSNRKAGDIALPSAAEKWFRELASRVSNVSRDGDPSRHFVIVPNGFELFQNRDDFLNAVRVHMGAAGRFKDHAFVFVHGYNVSFDHALFRTAQLAYDLGVQSAATGDVSLFGTPFLYSWPSAAAVGQYPYDQESSRLAVEHLKIYLKMVIEQSGAKKVHLIAHSMGNVVMLNALSQLGEDLKDDDRVQQIILASPDVDAAEFRRLTSRVRTWAPNVTMYASAADVALKASRKFHNGRVRAGDVADNIPTTSDGVHTIDVSALSNCYFCVSHNEYVEQPVLLKDISQLIVSGRLPPHRRNQKFVLPRKLLAGLKRFWRYRPELQ